MAEIDALSVSRGTNRGEAAFLGESGFDATELAYRLGQQQKADRKVRKAEEAEGYALLNDKIKTQWDSDTYNYFEPKVKELRTSIMDTMKNQRGVLTPIQKMQFKGAWDELRTSAEVNNKLFESYQNQVKQLEADPQGEKWDRNVSIQKLQMFRDPYSVPELKADIQKNYGGDINKWRTANYAKFGLEPSFSFEKYIGDVTKDEKQQEYVVKNDKGETVYGTRPTGERFTTVGKKFSPEQVQSITNRVWNENNFRSEKARENAKSYVEDVFSIGEDRSVMFNSSLTDAERNIAKKAIEYAGDMRGLNDTEMKKRLAKGYLSATIDIKGDLGQEQKDIGFAPTPAKPAGGGKGFRDRFTVSVTPLNELSKDLPVSFPAQSNPLAPWFSTNKQKTPYIAIEPIGGKSDTESIQLSISGKQIRPIGYKIQGDKVYMRGAESKQVETGQFDSQGQPKVKEQYVVTEDIPVTGEIAGNIAAHYGFKTFEEFRDMLEKESGSTAKQTNKSKPSKSVPMSTIKGLVGKKGYEGYTEQELIDYYKSQGYEVK